MTVSHTMPYRNLTPAHAFTVYTSARIIDVREPHERDGGYIDGSENVPLGQLVQRARFWDKHDTLILVCRSGNRSALAARQLTAEGFDNVFNLAGGMQAYVAAGLPVRIH